MKMSFNRLGIEDAALRRNRVRGSLYDMLLYTVLQKPRDGASGGIVIAICSSNPGEGVTYVSRALLHDLAQCEVSSAAGVNVSFLRKLHEPTLEGIRRSIGRKSVPLSDADEHSDSHDDLMLTRERGGSWEGSWQYRKDRIDLLRSQFEYTIIDCPSLKESGDLLAIAPFVDGVIMVAEANRTRRDQPRHAEKNIRGAGGNLLGYVMNKQTRDVPRWLMTDA